MSYGNIRHWTSYKRYFLPAIEVKDYNRRMKVMINGRNFFDQPVKNNLRVFDNIWKTTAGWVDDYSTGCLVDYPCC